MRNELPCWGCLNVIYFNKWHWIYLKLTTMKEEWKVLKFSWNNNRTAKQGALRDGSEWQFWWQAPWEGCLGRMLPEARERLRACGGWGCRRGAHGLGLWDVPCLSSCSCTCADPDVWAGRCLWASEMETFTFPRGCTISCSYSSSGRRVLRQLPLSHPDFLAGTVYGHLRIKTMLYSHFHQLGLPKLDIMISSCLVKNGV